jgi:hypothetical protein
MDNQSNHLKTPKVLSKIPKHMFIEPVWLRGCVLIKTQFAAVWLKEKVIYCSWVPLVFCVGNAVKEKQGFLPFLALFMLIALFTEQCN